METNLDKALTIVRMTSVADVTTSATEPNPNKGQGSSSGGFSKP